VLLYRLTGDQRYLKFCRYIVSSWSEKNGPHIIESLTEHGHVNQTANAKAYEMLSNLVGLCELARATGDRQLLKPVLNAWQDIVDKRLYVTGACSQSEHFRDDYYLPNQMGAHVGEQCVTTTWIQLNWQLLRLTGEARFGDQLEKTFYNQLSAAQRPDGAEWCYFTSPEGTKPYGPGINCCVSSGPRGMALVPQCAALRMRASKDRPETLWINLWESMTIQTRLAGKPVTVKWQTGFPLQGSGTLEIQSDGPVAGAVRLRVPAWARPCTPSFQGGTGARVQSGKEDLTLQANDWTGAKVSLKFNLDAAMIEGDHGNKGLEAFTWGPFVLAFDQQQNPGWPVPRRIVVPEGTHAASAKLASTSSEPLSFSVPLARVRDPEPEKATLVPFADAGRDGGRYSVWLRTPRMKTSGSESLFLFADETRSEQGNVDGSITDGDSGTFVVTFNARPQQEAWFAVQLDAPQQVRRVVVAHGRTFHDGGWFDAEASKPRIEVKRDKDAAWEKIGELADYPATSNTDSKGLRDGQAFTLQLKEPVTAVALRVVGKPACGDNPNQSFASCAELEGFAE